MAYMTNAVISIFADCHVFVHNK